MKPMIEQAFEWFRGRDIAVVTLSVLQRNWSAPSRGIVSASPIVARSGELKPRRETAPK